MAPIKVMLYHRLLFDLNSLLTLRSCSFSSGGVLIQFLTEALVTAIHEELLTLPPRKEKQNISPYAYITITLSWNQVEGGGASKDLRSFYMSH